MTEPAGPASSESDRAPVRDLVARVDFQYRWRSWAFAILMLGIGLWSLNDGFVVWPRDNAAWQAMGARADRPLKPPHDTPGVLFNQFAGILCTAISIPFLIWREYRSRGEYRLAGDTLRVPGHEPIKLDQIRGLDLMRLDRKGIAIIEYERAPGQIRSLTLNDMIYQRGPTERIVARVEAHLEALDAKENTDARAS